MARRSGRKRHGNSLARLLLIIVGVLVLIGFILKYAVVTVPIIIAIGAFIVWRWWRGQQTRRISARTLGELRSLTPTQFERFIAQLLQDLGYQQVKHTGGPGDLAADIICRDGDGFLTAVQCKRYAPDHHVGSPAVQQFIGMMTVHHHADRGIYVTTSSFTQPAINLARQHNVTLIDGVALTAQLRRTYGQDAKAVAA